MVIMHRCEVETGHVAACTLKKPFVFKRLKCDRSMTCSLILCWNKPKKKEGTVD